MFNHFMLVLLLPSAHSCIFSIPEVTVEVYQPRGLRVKIPHQEGIQLFAFHANVNKNISKLSVGKFYKDVWLSHNDWWIVENRKMELRKGDRLNYWYYILCCNKGYRIDNQVYKVNELIRGQMPDLINTNVVVGGGVGDGEGGVEVNEQSEKINLECEEAKNSARICTDTVYKLTQQFVNVSLELETLRKRNELLSEIIKQRPTYKMLTMRGRISRDDDPISVVKFVLNEKLDLQPDIISAIRNEDQSITFQLSDLTDVLNILNEAGIKLANATSVSIVSEAK